MVQFIFEQVSLVRRASFWLAVNLTPWVEFWRFPLPTQGHVWND